MTKRTCTLEGCERPHTARGLCGTHRNQLRRFGEFRPLAHVNGRGLVRDSGGNKQCWRCKKWANESEYYPDSSRRDGLATNCKSCTKWMRKRQMYGLDEAAFAVLLASQGGGCAACGTAEPGGKTNAWHVDHDHSCCPYGHPTCGRCVRGILCHSCNLILGHAKDDIETLHGLALYLAEWSGDGGAPCAR